MLDAQVPGGPPESALEAVERAEQRLEERSSARLAVRAKILARRARRQRYRLPVVIVALGVLGAVVFLATLQAAGGDLSGVRAPFAHLIVAAELFGPAALAARFSRREGWAVAVAVGVCVFAISLVLAIGVGFLALGLGPE